MQPPPVLFNAIWYVQILYFKLNFFKYKFLFLVTLLMKINCLFHCDYVNFLLNDILMNKCLLLSTVYSSTHRMRTTDELQHLLQKRFIKTRQFQLTRRLSTHQLKVPKNVWLSSRLERTLDDLNFELTQDDSI